MNLRCKVERYIRRYQMLSPGDTVICAVSGGADSLCLLRLILEMTQGDHLNVIREKKESCQKVNPRHAKQTELKNAKERVENLCGLQVRALHVHHGIRGEAADADADYVQKVCADWGVPVTVKYVDAPALAKKEHTGLEEAARKLRYQALFEEADKIERENINIPMDAAEKKDLKKTSSEKRDSGKTVSPNRHTRETSSFETTRKPRVVIAVAHNRDDNAETLLMHLCRGAGLRGLSGIAPVKELPVDAFGAVFAEPDDASNESSEKYCSVPTGGKCQQNQQTQQNQQNQQSQKNALNMIRPLLETSRAEIESFLRERKISWCTDETNADTTYTRNAVRQDLLPYLTKHINAQAPRHLAEAAEHLREAAVYLERQSERAYHECLDFDGALDLTKLRNQDDLIQSEVLKMAIAQNKATVNKIENHETASSKSRTRDKVNNTGASMSHTRDTVNYTTDAKNNRNTRDGAAVSLERSHMESLKNLLLSSEGTVSLNLPEGITAERRYDKLYFHAAKKKGQKADEKVATGRLVLPTEKDECIVFQAGTDERLEMMFLEMPQISKISQVSKTSQVSEKKRVGADCDGGIEAEDGYINPLTWECKDAFRSSYTNRLDYDKIDEVLCSEKEDLKFRKREEKDHILIAGNRHKTLKKYMIDDKIPACAREGLYVLAAGNRVLWVPGFYTEPGLMARKDSKRVLELSYIR